MATIGDVATDLLSDSSADAVGASGAVYFGSSAGLSPVVDSIEIGSDGSHGYYDFNLEYHELEYDGYGDFVDATTGQFIAQNDGYGGLYDADDYGIPTNMNGNPPVDWDGY